MHDSLRRDDGATARTAFDHHRLAEAICQPLPDQPRGNVSGAARRIADDEVHRPRRISLRCRVEREGGQRNGAGCKMQESSAFHVQVLCENDRASTLYHLAEPVAAGLAPACTICSGSITTGRSQATNNRMTDTRLVPHHSHWGAFLAEVADGRFVGVKPFPRDPHPSPLLEAMPAAVMRRAELPPPWCAKAIWRTAPARRCAAAAHRAAASPSCRCRGSTRSILWPASLIAFAARTAMRPSW